MVGVCSGSNPSSCQCHAISRPFVVSMLRGHRGPTPQTGRHREVATRQDTGQTAPSSLQVTGRVPGNPVSSTCLLYALFIWYGCMVACAPQSEPRAASLTHLPP